MIPFNLESGDSGSAAAPFSVSVIGIGGSGTNVIDKIALEGMPGADLVSMNCDARSLQSSMSATKLQLGKSLTQGLGCGGDPELGAEAAMGSQSEIRDLLAGRNMVFLCVGLGGGTGSGAAPAIARMAREAGAFVVVFATLPFAFEGRRRSNQAAVALQDLRKYANALVTFENDRMGELVVPKKGVQEAFELADKIIGQSVRAVTSLVTQPGLISIGMDDLITALRHTDSRCLFGYGQAKGENRAVEALGQALKSPLLDRGQMQAGARNVLVHICGGTTLTLFEIETLMRELGKHVHEDAQILFGAATDPKLNEHLSVTILTSLSKAAPAVEIEETAVVTEQPSPASPAPAVEVSPPPAAAAPEPTAPEPAVETQLPTAESPIVEVTVPEPRSEAVVIEAPLPTPEVDLEEEDLFPELIAAAAPAVDVEEESETKLIEIPALVATATVILHEVVEEVVEAAIDEDKTTPIAWAEPELQAEPEFEPAVETEVVAEEPEAGELLEEEPVMAEVPTAPQAPEPETVPERVIRLDRPLPAPAARHQSSPPARPEPVRREPARPEPVRPIPITPAASAAPGKRFVLSEIIKAKSKPPASPPADPIMEYEAEEDYPAPPVRPMTAPAARRAPDYDSISPIRPIPAGRSTTPASPFSPAKSPAPQAAPAAAATAARPVPTQQQTFDERLQPVSNGSRFERAKPTVEEGEDLDVPTFLRRKR